MLVFKQKHGLPMKVGEAVIVAYRDGQDFKICVDAPESVTVKRDEVLMHALSDAGYEHVHGNEWRRPDGTRCTTRDALEEIDP